MILSTHTGQKMTARFSVTEMRFSVRLRSGGHNGIWQIAEKPFVRQAVCTFFV